MIKHFEMKVKRDNLREEAFEEMLSPQTEWYEGGLEIDRNKQRRIR